MDRQPGQLTMGKRKHFFCTLPGCGQPHLCGGYCNKHYLRWKRYGDPTAFQHSREAMIAKFWQRVRKGPYCWEWMGARTSYGYGAFYTQSLGHPLSLAHRFSYEIHKGSTADGVVRHRCDNPRCVNPAHLELGTQADNVRDSVERGRNARGEVNGHAKLTEPQVREIKAALATGAKHLDLAKRFTVTRSLITLIANRQRWAHVDL